LFSIYFVKRNLWIISKNTSHGKSYKYVILHKNSIFTQISVTEASKNRPIKCMSFPYVSLFSLIQIQADKEALIHTCLVLLHYIFVSALYGFTWFIISFKIASTQPEWNSILNKTHSKYKRDTCTNLVKFHLITIIGGIVILIVGRTKKIKTWYWHLYLK